MSIMKTVSAQKAFFATGKTFDINFRKESLRRLKNVIHSNEDAILRALREDLNKSEQEAYMTEIGLVYDEISYMLRHIDKLSRPEKTSSPLSLFPAASYALPSPYGTVLIMSPWNYPFMLAMEPLADAMAAGNTAVLKPSNYSPATSRVIKKIVSEAFGEEYVAVVEGGREANGELLDETFDYIFFTGGKQVGRLVMEKASKNLTPVTLELGGKSPLIIDETADIKLAARRAVFGKFMNAGQTCVAPDYAIVHENALEKFLKYVKEEITRQYSSEPLKNDAYVRIVNEKHFRRILSLMEGVNIYCGGMYDEGSLKIEPTVLTEVSHESPVMGQEIFGPLLPVMTYGKQDELFEIIGRNPTPLALYIFTKDKALKAMITKRVLFGGGCVNDTLMHLSNNSLAFGGVGTSGMGQYHGKYGFETFSHKKSIVDRKCWADISLRYQPYSERKLNIIKKILK